MSFVKIIKLPILMGLPVILWSCHNYRDQFENQEKINGLQESMSKGDLNAGPNYAASAWPAPHRDVRNTDYNPFFTSADVRFAWIELEHAGFFIGPTIGPEGNTYLPTGYGAGYSNLYCFDRFGNKLWESEKLVKGKELEGVDYGCEINAPIIDQDGNIYQCDFDQVWSFTDAGMLRWVTNLRDYDIQGMFISPFFTPDGYIGGCTTDGYVALFDMQTGKLVFDKLKLPGTKGPKSLKMIDHLWETQMGPEIRQLAWDAVFGCNMQCSNTPAMDPEKDRIFIIANGFSEDEGMIHRVDITPEGLKLVFSISTGTGGSGTSPDITFDGKMVIFTDGTGFFTGVDTETGEVKWRNDTKSVTGVSSTTTPNGMAINYSYNYLTAYDAYTGELLWKTNLDNVVADKDLKGLVARRSTPSAVVASSVMATPDKLWMIVLSCAKMALTEKQKERNTSGVFPIKGMPMDSVRIPQRYYLCSFDYKGNLLSKTPAPGDGAMVTSGTDGRLYVTGLSAYSDVVYHQTPWFVRTTPEPTAGFWCFEPVSFKKQAGEALLFMAKYFDPDSGFENFENFTETQKADIALEQLKGIRISLEEAEARKEIETKELEGIITRLEEISGYISDGNNEAAHSAIIECSKLF